MTSHRAASRYALAIFGLADETKHLELVSKDFKEIEKLIKASRDFYLFLKSPIINRAKKKTVLTNLFQGKVSELTYQFLLLLAAKNREELLPEIILQFERLLDEKQGLAPVTIRTASPFTKDQELRLTEWLKQIIKKTPKLQFIQDASLIGGFAVQYEDTVYDGSVRHQLEILKRRFVLGT